MPEIPIEHFVSQMSWLLLGAALVGIAARRLRVPYAVALVLAGLAIEASGVVDVPQLDPGIVLFAFLPPLLFDAAFRIDERELRAVVRPVAWLALPGVLLTTALVGVVAWLALGVSFGAGLLFGSIVAATDPVAVIAILTSQKVPQRIAVIPEAESLVNDGIAITLYTALVGYAISGEFKVFDVLEIFGREVFGGLAIGVLLALVFSRLTAAIDDHALEMMISTVLAYGSYLVANEVHASGPLACVAAGFVHGTYGRAFGMSAQTSERLDDLWEYLGFVANAIVFMLVGFSVKGGRLLDDWGSVAVAIAVVVIARVVAVSGTRWAMPPGGYLPHGERLIMIWAGLRGALTAALALALPDNTPHRELLITMAFGVVLFTLVAQGLTLSPLLRRLGFDEDAMTDRAT